MPYLYLKKCRSPEPSSKDRGGLVSIELLYFHIFFILFFLFYIQRRSSRILLEKVPSSSFLAGGCIKKKNNMYISHEYIMDIFIIIS
jgi:hypothetical protein